MKYYVYMCVVNIVFHLIAFGLFGIISLVFECYVLICSKSLCEECLAEVEDENSTENTAMKFNAGPSARATSYNSYENEVVSTDKLQIP